MKSDHVHIAEIRRRLGKLRLGVREPFTAPVVQQITTSAPHCARRNSSDAHEIIVSSEVSNCSSTGRPLDLVGRRATISRATHRRRDVILVVPRHPSEQRGVFAVMSCRTRRPHPRLFDSPVALESVRCSSRLQAYDWCPPETRFGNHVEVHEEPSRRANQRGSHSRSPRQALQRGALGVVCIIDVHVGNVVRRSAKNSPVLHHEGLGVQVVRPARVVTPLPTSSR